MLCRDSLSCWRSVGWILVNPPRSSMFHVAGSLLTTPSPPPLGATHCYLLMGVHDGMISSPQSWACWPSPWPSLWAGSRRCSERRRTRWAPRKQTRSRSRSRRLAPWWPTLEAGRSGRSPSGWSWWEQSWSLWQERRQQRSHYVMKSMSPSGSTASNLMIPWLLNSPHHQVTIKMSPIFTCVFDRTVKSEATVMISLSMTIQGWEWNALISQRWEKTALAGWYCFAGLGHTMLRYSLSQ